MWSNSETVTCVITTHDKISSIDLASLKFSYSTNGTNNYGFWRPITEIDPGMDGYRFNISVHVKFKNGINNYIRWSVKDNAGHMTVSDDYQIKIDIIPIKFDETSITPKDYQWFNVNTVTCSISINDFAGSGVDADSIEYSTSTTGLYGFTNWAQAGIEFQELINNSRSTSPSTPTGLVSESLKATINLDFEEGYDNYIYWRGTDVAGNAYTYSEKQVINIDKQNVEFSNPVPNEKQIMDDLEQLCKITINDVGGSNVDHTTVECRFSSNGLNGFSDWTHNSITSEDENTFFTYLVFNEGSDNYIQWRAYDISGNGPQKSEKFKIIINSPPTAVITKPNKNQEFSSNDEILFDASGSTDLDHTDELQYKWISNISKLFGESVTFDYRLPPGMHEIILVVNDNHGHTSTTQTTLIINRYIPPIVDPPEQDNENIDDLDNVEAKAEKEVNYDYLIVIFLLIVLVIVIIIISSLIKKHNQRMQTLQSEPSKDIALTQQQVQIPPLPHLPPPDMPTPTGFSPIPGFSPGMVMGMGIGIDTGQAPINVNANANVPQQVIHGPNQTQFLQPIQGFIPQPSPSPFTLPFPQQMPQPQQQSQQQSQLNLPFKRPNNKTNSKPPDSDQKLRYF